VGFSIYWCEDLFERQRKRHCLIKAFRKVLADVRIKQASITGFAENDIIASFYPFLE